MSTSAEHITGLRQQCGERQQIRCATTSGSGDRGTQSITSDPFDRQSVQPRIALPRAQNNSRRYFANSLAKVSSMRPNCSSCSVSGAGVCARWSPTELRRVERERTENLWTVAVASLRKRPEPPAPISLHVVVMALNNGRVTFSPTGHDDGSTMVARRNTKFLTDRTHTFKQYVFG